MAIQFLSASTNMSKFFDLLIKHDIFEYSLNDFVYIDVEKIAEEHGVIVEYCKPGTQVYEDFGCFMCKVIDKIDLNEDGSKKDLPKFDPEELMI